MHAKRLSRKIENVLFAYLTVLSRSFTVGTIDLFAMTFLVGAAKAFQTEILTSFRYASEATARNPAIKWKTNGQIPLAHQPLM
jgi:hypothetical protein